LLSPLGDSSILHKKFLKNSFGTKKKFTTPSIFNRKWGILQFSIRNRFKIHLEQFPLKIEIALNFIFEIPLKINRTKKKGHQKIENSPSVLQKKSLKNYSEQKKINPEIWSQKYTTRTLKLENIFEKIILAV